MTRPRRKPALPGRVHVVCSHGQDGEPLRIQVLRRISRPGHPDGAGFISRSWPAEEGGAYSFRCGRCRRHLRIARDRFLQAVDALAAMQGAAGGVPVVADIVWLERSL